MNKQESDILNTLLLEPFINQRILSEVSITVKKHEMPLYSKLLPIWSGGDQEIWSNQGRSISSMEDLKV